MACIPPEEMERLKKEFLGKGGVSGFRKMTADDRVDFFYNFLTRNMKDLSKDAQAKYRENAESFASRVEEQILLESQKGAVSEWANLGVAKRPPEDILSLINKNTEILSPADGNPYMDLLVRQKLGFGLAQEDAVDLLNLANTANTAMENFKAKYGENLENYNDLEDFSDERAALGDALLKFKEKYSELYLKGKTRNQGKVGKAFYEVAGAYKALRASFDVSFGRNLSGAMIAGEKGAWKGWWQGIQTFFKGVVDPKYASQLEMMLLTRKNALNGNYARFGLDIGMAEDVFPPSFWDNLEAGLNLISRSDEAFRIASQYSRANLFDTYWDMAMKEMNGDTAAVIRLFEQGSIGNYINSITGRGKTGLEGTQWERKLNYVMFSPKWLAARWERVWDLRFVPAMLMGKTGGKFDQKTMRAKASLKLALFSILIGGLTRAAFDDDEDKWQKFINPISPTFMQAKFGNFVIDQSFGASAIIRDIARGITGYTQTQEGVNKAQARGTTLMRFFASKESPIATAMITGMHFAGYEAGVIQDKPKQFGGEEWTFEDALLEVPPIGISSALKAETKEDWGAMALDILGISSRGIGADRTKPGMSERVIKEQGRIARAVQKQSPGTQLGKTSALNTKLTGAKRERAQKDFEQMYNRELEKFFASPRYRRMSIEKRDEEQRSIRRKVQDNLKKKYGIK